MQRGSPGIVQVIQHARKGGRPGQRKRSALVKDVPRLIVRQAMQPLRLTLRTPLDHPKTQRGMANLVNDVLTHEIRAGGTHRFIRLIFVTLGERVFRRRYTYGEPSWHSAFRAGPAGPIELHKTVVTTEARVPQDRDDIIPAVDLADGAQLKALGVRFMLSGAIGPRAQESTIELTLAKPT